MKKNEQTESQRLRGHHQVHQYMDNMSHRRRGKSILRNNGQKIPKSDENINLHIQEVQQT